MKKKFTGIIGFILFMQLAFAQSQFSTDGDSTFNSSNIHTVNIYFADATFWDSLTIYHAIDQCYMGSVNIDGQQLDSVCVQLKGNSSYNSMPGVKKSIKLSFDEYTSQKYDGLKTLNLNNSFKDPTLMREKLMCDFLNAHGVPAPRCTYTHVYINSTYWGFYTMVEQVNKTFCTYRFNNNDGNLYKGDPHGDLKWKGPLASTYYSEYELKTNTTTNDWTDLVNLLNKINNTPATNFYDSLEVVLQTDIAIKAWAADVIFANLDSYRGSGHNYYIYHDTITNKFNWIAWDMNEAFGNFNMGLTLQQIKTLPLFFIPNPATNRPLTNNLIQNNFYQQQYLNYVLQWIAYDFSPAYFYPKIDSIANAIRNFVYADPNKQFTNSNFDFNIDHDMGAIPGLKDFIQIRRDNIIQQLITLGFPTAGMEEVNSLYNISVFPNPVNDVSTINVSEIKNASIKIYDIGGRLMKSFNKISSGVVYINRNDFGNGVFIIEILSDNAIVAHSKIIIL